MSVKASHEVLLQEESDKLLDNDLIVHEAIEMVENSGIVFIDEIDKISARSGRHGADVSREGAARSPAADRGNDGQHQAWPGPH